MSSSLSWSFSLLLFQTCGTRIIPEPRLTDCPWSHWAFQMFQPHSRLDLTCSLRLSDCKGFSSEVMGTVRMVGGSLDTQPPPVSLTADLLNIPTQNPRRQCGLGSKCPESTWLTRKEAYALSSSLTQPQASQHRVSQSTLGCYELTGEGS